VYAGGNALTRSDDSGAVAIIVALLAVTLFGFAALVVDIGNADSVHEQGQSTVDAAALAGVRTLAGGGSEDDVVNVVKQYVTANMGTTNWAGCTDPSPLVPADTDASDTCISTKTSPIAGIESYQVRVKLPPKHVPSTFAGLFGVTSIAISPVAQALSGQPLPPECGPCDPALDETTGQPIPPFVRPFALPDPATVTPAAPPGPLAGGCPTPGLFTPDAFPTGVTVQSTYACTLKPGLYVFDNTNFDVEAGANIASYSSGGTDGLPIGTGVTLVFYGTGTLTVEGKIGIRNPGQPGQPDTYSPLLASSSTLVPQGSNQPIPGVAIVFDQFDPGITANRTFTLGDGFDITGSVYALDGQTTWATKSGDCPAIGSTCLVNADGAASVIATTNTAFADGGRIPTVGPEPATPPPPPSAPHLVK
jgi:Putative Flp pilus-assembly TadE/G-like